MGLLETLQSMLPKEATVLGSSIEDAAKSVDLSIAYTPVLDEFIHAEEDLHRYIPTPVRCVKDGLRYCLMFGKDYRWVSEDQVKEMRARYLLVHNWYYANFDGFPHSQKMEIIAKFFKGGMWRPKQGSELSKLMGLEGT